MIEMPQLCLGQRSLKGCSLGRPALDGEPWRIGTGHHCRAGLVVDNLKEDSPDPFFRMHVSNIRADGNLRVPACKIRNSFNINALHKRFRGNEQLHRPVDASVMRPVAGTPPRHHVLVERIVSAHGKGVRTSQPQQVSDIKHEGGVAFAGMFSGQLPVYPDFRCVEYSLKLESYRGVLPFTRSVEGSEIPGDTSIVDKSKVNLPSVRHVHRAPRTGGFVEFVPTLLLTGAPGIRLEPPFATETHCLWQAHVSRVTTGRECRRANGASGQGPGLSHEFPTRMHSYTPQFGPICRVFFLETKGRIFSG